MTLSVLNQAACHLDVRCPPRPSPQAAHEGPVRTPPGLAPPPPRCRIRVSREDVSCPGAARPPPRPCRGDPWQAPARQTLAACVLWFPPPSQTRLCGRGALPALSWGGALIFLVPGEGFCLLSARTRHRTARALLYCCGRRRRRLPSCSCPPPPTVTASSPCTRSPTTVSACIERVILGLCEH